MKRTNEEGTSYTKEKQGELFTEFQTAQAKKAGPSFRRDMVFGKRVVLNLSYENIILLFIGFIMILVILFSLGVERGKAISRKAKITPIAAEMRKPIQKELPPAVKKDEKAEFKTERPNKTEIVKDSELKPYTIQVVSFKNEEGAKKEIESLKNEGYKAFILPSNDWFQVCVGHYADKEQSQKDFDILKRKYPTCYFRRIER